jgi:Glycosyl transferase family 90
VLDIDGNGYSGRFLRLLMSNSVPVKMTVFREWINDWIIPWVHYVPAQQDEEFSDLPEILRFLTSERGDIIGKEIAEMGQKWTKQVITKESLRLWFLRLLMEYGRLVNDNRDNMNFVL